jgi:DNA polymerase-3 subunit gamma/tau
MPYLVLARKYRPKTFDEVVGQQTVTRTLRNAIATGRIGHAFLLSGARGVGKTSTARLLAKALNCSKADVPTPDPCGECASCLEIADAKSLDVQEIDGASNNGVEQVRELRESARYNPARDRFKIWIIDEVHMLSMPAFNALLKTLEEPPPRVKFVFATTEYHKLPDTILSRCQQYDFRMIPAAELSAHLKDVAHKEGVKISEAALDKIARAAEGSVRDALSLFDQVLSFSGQQVKDEDLQALLGLIDRELLRQASRAVADGDTRAVFELSEKLADYGADYRNFARELLLHFRELLLLKLAPDSPALLAGVLPEERQKLAALQALFSEEDLLRAFEVLQQAELDLRQNPQDPRVTLEFSLLKLAQLRKLVPFAELVERVERLGGAPAAAAPARAAAALPRGAPAAAPPAPTPAAPPPPAVAAPPAAAPREPVAQTLSGPDGELLEALVGLTDKRPSLREPLRGARARLDGDTLVVETLPDYRALAELHADEYRELLHKAAGRALKLRFEQASAPARRDEPAPSPAADKKQRLLEQATREPAVQEVLELFGGKVVDVREA